MSSCDRLDEVRDYALDEAELDAPSRASLEQHLAACQECAVELDRLQVTASALRMLPDREVPQRIAFVSDKIFEPSPAASWFGGLWNSAARLGFASACVLAAALVLSAWHRPAEVRIVAGGPGTLSSADVSRQIGEAVGKAVAQVRAEDAKMTQALLESSNVKQERRYNSLMVTMRENMDYLEKQVNTDTMLASSDAARSGTGQ